MSVFVKKPNVYRLKNGLRIILLPIPSIKIVRCGYWSKNGILYENEPYLESAHFLEHLIGHFLSEKFPDGRKNTKALDQLGAVSNAHTTEHYTQYWIEGKREHLGHFMNLLYNSNKNFKIDENIFKHESQAVVEELQEIQNDQYNKFNEVQDKILWPTYSLEKSLKQRIKDVKNATHESINTYYKSTVGTNNTLFYVVGDFDETKVLQSFKNILGNIPQKEIASLKPQPIYPLVDNPLIYFIPNKKVMSIKCDIVWKIPFTTFDDEFYPLLIFSSIFAKGFNSRLMQKLRHDNGIVYSIKGNLRLDPIDPNLSYFSVNTFFSQGKMADAIRLISQELINVKKNGFDKNEIEKIKNKMQYQYLKTQQEKDLGEIVSFYGLFNLWNQPMISFHNYHQKILNTSLKDVNEIAKKINLKQMRIFYSGPNNHNKEIIDILESL